jgi:hypothetical protein
MGRAIDPSAMPKYHSTRFDKGRWLYGCHQVPNGRPGVLVEGNLDAVAVSSFGYNGLAVTSKSLSLWQAALAVRYAHNGYLIIWPDSDAETVTNSWGRMLARVGLSSTSPKMPYSPFHDGGKKMDADWLRKNDPDWINDLLNSCETKIRCGR